jgi:methyltransferase (TIGR00027 family)
MSKDSSIKHVSDTALWVAHYRANEARRADAIFHDPLATLLSGERGRQIARSFPRSGTVAWGTVVRTSAIDHLIDEALELGVDTVLNLGAGLDTRPYRMRLPAHLRWIEIDFPSIIELKRSKLSQHTPVCILERVGMDLLNRSSRSAIFAQYGSRSNRTLLITEGVIPFISAPDVAILARELAAVSSFRYWISDFANLTSKRKMPKGWEGKLKAAPYLFEADDWMAFFKQTGWHPRKVITTGEESERINRPYPLNFPVGLIMRALPREVRRRILGLSGAVLMHAGEGQNRGDL